MQQNHPQPEISQNHMIRRLVSKFRKPSDATAATLLSSNTLQVPSAHLPTISGSVSIDIDPSSSSKPGDSSAGGGAGTKSGTSSLEGAHHQPMALPNIQRSLMGSKSRWSQLVASAAAGAGSTSGSTGATAKPAQSSSTAPTSNLRALLDIQGEDSNSANFNQNAEQSGGRRDGDDELDENYLRHGGKGHQALLATMEKG